MKNFKFIRFLPSKDSSAKEILNLLGDEDKVDSCEIY